MAHKTNFSENYRFSILRALLGLLVDFFYICRIKLIKMHVSYILLSNLSNNLVCI